MIESPFLHRRYLSVPLTSTEKQILLTRTSPPLEMMKTSPSKSDTQIDDKDENN